MVPYWAAVTPVRWHSASVAEGVAPEGDVMKMVDQVEQMQPQAANALQAGLFYALATWAVARYHEAGLTLLHSNALFSISMLMGMPSAFLLPWLAQRFGNRYGLLVACGLVASVSLAMITLVPTFAPEFWAVTIGFGLGGSFALSLVLPLYEAGSPLAVSRWTAMMLCMGYSMACLTPVLTGLARDLAGHYQLPFMVLTSLALLMTALAWVMRRGPHHA